MKGSLNGDGGAYMLSEQQRSTLDNAAARKNRIQTDQDICN